MSFKQKCLQLNDKIWLSDKWDIITKTNAITIIGQSPDYWDKDFEEFLQTYNEFKRKKYEKLTSQNQQKGKING